MEKPHKKLEAWKLGIEVVKHIYKLTSGFPKAEDFALTAQLRRSAVSIPSNVAEGAGRKTNKEFINFLHIAQGSLSELDTQLDIALELGYLSRQDRKAIDELIIKLDKILTGLIHSLRRPE
ncbi:four helix bundle protein [Desulfacinum infernum DSM 9756]|uniref:Four helix bundle protein n=1 Tax=Desulfacinum infernum DSM 9756 TaxID=1121391 RepID=A0A1M5FG78_9BACT|nr:four helix bundle protein [Desulfacinum infernum]SHF90151.1 four helix bundle protein [Desulfacinum infernum DSM 9756]